MSKPIMINQNPLNTSHPSMNIAMGHYRFYFTAIDTVRFQPFSGSSWRGAFGHQLKNSLCIQNDKNCDTCIMQAQCPYTLIFNTPLPHHAERFTNYTEVPRPYLIEPALNQQPVVWKGDTFFVDIKLVGHTERHLPYIVHTMENIGRKGLKYQGQYNRFALQSIDQCVAGREWQTVYEPKQALNAATHQPIAIKPLPDEAIALRLLTPFRYKQHGRLVGQKELSLHSVLSAAKSRIDLLNMVYGDGAVLSDTLDIAPSKAIEPLQKSVSWQEVTRHSARQKQQMQQGGVVGKLVFSPEQLAPYWSLLTMAEALHVGKDVVMGLGRLSVSGLLLE